MNLIEFYHAITKTLIVPSEFNELLTDLPLDTKIIIFDDNEHSKFNQHVDNLPRAR